MGLSLARSIMPAADTPLWFDLSETDVPPEVISRVLTHVPVTDCLTSCRLVCRAWREIIDSRAFWKMRCDITGIHVPSHLHAHVDWRLLAWKSPFNRNLVKNWRGEDGTRDWTVTANGGNRFKVETDQCPGALPMPVELITADVKKAWATSYGLCSKTVSIKLLEEGLTPDIIDNIKPEIHFSEWWSSRQDCGCQYAVQVQLVGLKYVPEEYDDCFITLAEFDETYTREQWNDGAWQQVTHTFLDYPAGVRIIRITHSGNDKQFWSGHYGAKFTATRLELKFPAR